MESGTGTRRPPDLAPAISERLREYVRDYCDNNQSAFSRRIGVPRTTVTGWFAVRPHTPDIQQLVALATKANINLDWLLLGEPPRLRNQPHPAEKTVERMRAGIVAELTAEFAGSGTGAAEIEEVVPRPDELFKILLDDCRNWAQVSGRIVGMSVAATKDGKEKIRLFVEPGPPVPMGDAT